MHYNNPNKSAGQSVVYNGKYHTLMNISVFDMIKQLFNLCAGRVDNSGLRFYHTSELRQHDAAVLMTGLAVAPGYAIPPKAKSFLTYGMCDTANIPKVCMYSMFIYLHSHNQIQHDQLCSVLYRFWRRQMIFRCSLRCCTHTWLGGKCESDTSGRPMTND